MIECACSCDGDSEGVFDRGTAIVREYRTCTECGNVIWPWQPHEVGLWWDCGACDDMDCGGGIDDYCDRDLDPTSVSYMCGACSNACEQLLCGD